jgi:hypothetical protein
VCLKVGGQTFNVRATPFEHFPHFGGIEDSEQQMLDSKEFVTRAARLVKGLIEAKLKLARQHC